MAINHKENIALIGFVGATMLSGALLTLPSALADDVVDTVTITVPTSCSISSTGENSHTAEIANGQHDSAIGETTIKAFCNDNEGFAIYAIGYTNNELGKNVLTNSTLGSTHDIVTGTAITGNTSQWAMKLSKLTGSEIHYPIIIAGSSEDSLKQTGYPDFSDFTNVPDDYKKVAYRTSSTDVNSEGSNTAEGSTLKTTYQAYISPTQAAGEYTGQVKYTMVHPHNGTAPQKPIYMQDLNASNINSILPNIGNTALVYDNRDETSYIIGKLADNKIWLLDNLALDLTDNAILSDMNESNTNASSVTLNYLKGISVRDPNTDPDGKYAVAGVSDDWSGGGSYSYTAPLVYMGNRTTVPNDSISNVGDADGQYKVGGYYNLCAASAGSYCYGGEAHPDITMDDITEDICPKGWRLPTSGEFENLGMIVFGSTSSISDEQAYEDYRAILRLSSPGSYDGEISDSYIGGGVWSSTRNNYSPDRSAIKYLNYARGIESNNIVVFTNYIANNSTGYSTRCVLDF